MCVCAAAWKYLVMHWKLHENYVTIHRRYYVVLEHERRMNEWIHALGELETENSEYDPYDDVDSAMVGGGSDDDETQK